MDRSIAATSSPIETEVLRIRALLEQRRFAEALAASQALLIELPENRDLIYMKAVSQRYLGDTAAALATLQQLEQHHPRFSRLYQERGHCHVALKDAPQAIEAYLKAVNINPALPASWTKLESLYRMTGQLANADTAAAHVATLRSLPPEIVTATALFSDGEWLPAEQIVRAYLLKHGNHIEAMRLLARIGIERDVLDDAEILLAAVLELAPDYQAARCDYARVLLERHQPLRARDQLEKLLKLEPEQLAIQDDVRHRMCRPGRT